MVMCGALAEAGAAKWLARVHPLQCRRCRAGREEFIRGTLTGDWTAWRLIARPGRASMEERLRRRVICAECPERREDADKIKCALCRMCGDREAWAARRSCPVGRWGLAERASDEAEYERRHG
jgi:hypothetical protein